MIETALETIDGLLSRLVLQPADDIQPDVCMYYTAMNLYVKCGLEPPPFEQLRDIMSFIWGESEPGRGVTNGEMIAMLQAMGFPRCFGAIALPPHASIKSFVKSMLDVGFQCVLTYSYIVELPLEGAIILGDRELAGMKIWLAHGLIPVSVDDDGINCIVGWEEVPIANVKAVEWPYFDWFRIGAGLQPVGVAREIVMVWPDVQAEKEN